MTKANLIKELSAYFKIQELVSKNVYDKYGENAWQFFDVQLLETILVLRKHIIKKPMVCNNWQSGGSYSQRGLRENIAPMVWSKTHAGVIYLSAHCLGKAADFSSSKVTADMMRKLIVEYQHELPHKVRVESGISAPTWLHIDVMTLPNQKEKVKFFEA